MHRKTIARQILCYNCNAAKQFNHVCPHKQQMTHVIPPDSRCVIAQ